MPGRGVLPDPLTDAIFELMRQRRAFGEPHEEHDPLVVLPLLADRERLEHLRYGLDLPVNLGGADAHAAGIQDGIGTAVDDHAVVNRELDVVTVMPHPRIALEVRG